MRRKRSATLRLPVPPGSRGIRKVSWAPRPVRDVSRLGARHGQEPARRTDHSEIKANRRVPSMGQLGGESSKRVQTGEPNCIAFIPLSARTRERAKSFVFRFESSLALVGNTLANRFFRSQFTSPAPR